MLSRRWPALSDTAHYIRELFDTSLRNPLGHNANAYDVNVLKELDCLITQRRIHSIHHRNIRSRLNINPHLNLTRSVRAVGIFSTTRTGGMPSLTTNLISSTPALCPWSQNPPRLWSLRDKCHRDHRTLARIVFIQTLNLTVSSLLSLLVATAVIAISSVISNYKVARSVFERPANASFLTPS